MNPRWLTVPYRSRLFTFASRPFYQVADRVLGSRFLQDIADFFTNEVGEIDGTRVYGHMDYGKRAPDLGWRMTDAWLSMAGAGSKGEPNGVPIDEWGIRMEARAVTGVPSMVARISVSSSPCKKKRRSSLSGLGAKRMRDVTRVALGARSKSSSTLSITYPKGA